MHRPSWARASSGTVARRALLLNSWNNARGADRQLVEHFLEMAYADVEDGLRTLAYGEDDPLVSLVDDTWHVVSPMDSWLLIGATMGLSDLERFNSIALQVLSDRDPVASLPVAKRLMATLEGHEPHYSPQLRRGIARTLALLGALDQPFGGGSSLTGGDVARAIVSELVFEANQDATFGTWEAIAPQLPLLAEAAPDEFLDGLEVAARGESPLARLMFGDVGADEHFLGERTSHTHFLWALERLAWSPEHLPRVVRILARLDDLDPGGRLTNRPAASLKSIFCPWHPDTSATSAERLTVLDVLRRRAPALSWLVMMSMLPSVHGFQLGQRGPEYRDWKQGEPVVLRSDYISEISGVAERLVVDAAGSAERIAQLVGRYDVLPPEAHDRLVDLLETSASSLSDLAARKLIWAALRDFTSRHREYPDAEWALPEPVLTRLDPSVERFRPTDVSESQRWLFASGLVHLEDVPRRNDFQAYQRELLARRAAAVDAILQQSGLDGVLTFASEVEVPAFVGVALAQVGDAKLDDVIIPILNSDDRNLASFAFAYCGESYRIGGWSWVDQKLSVDSLDERQLGLLLSATHETAEAWSRAESLGEGVRKEYWLAFNYYGLGADFDAVSDVAFHLCEVGRYASAIDLIAIYSGSLGDDPEVAAAAAEALEAIRADGGKG